MAVCPAVKAVGYFSGKADGFHPRQPALGFCLPRKEGKQEDNKNEVSFHGTHLTFSSLTVPVRTRSSFSTSND